MNESATIQSNVAKTAEKDDSFWNGLLEDLRQRRCVLFLGPSLPVYANGSDKFDFYSYASLHLSKYLTATAGFDPAQSRNIFYTSQKYLRLNDNFPFRLEDALCKLYETETKRIREEGLPILYKNIARLPWHTVVNTQPDNFLENAFKENIHFDYYDFKKNRTVKNLEDDQFLVYNLFGAVTKEKDRYKTRSLVLTEADQIDFVKNVIKEDPPLPESVVSRFDDKKRYVFLDFNLENWHFRLLLEALKLNDKSRPLSPRHPIIPLSTYTKEFYKNRYGFVFIENNSEEFIQELAEKYEEEERAADDDRSVQPVSLFVAYDDADEESVRLLIKHLDPWMQKGALSVWARYKNVIGGQRKEKEEKEAMEKADCVLLMVSVELLNEPAYSDYVAPAFAKAWHPDKRIKVVAMITRGCPWEETAVGRLPHIVPADKIPLRSFGPYEPDDRFKQAALELSNILWQK